MTEPAVYWSNYETVRTQIEYETRHKISKQLDEFTNRCRERGLNGHFIAGLDYANEVVLGHTPQVSTTTSELNSETLF